MLERALGVKVMVERALGVKVMVERAEIGEREALGVWWRVCLEEKGWGRGTERVLWRKVVLLAGYPV